jgi:hypothetical protein
LFLYRAITKLSKATGKEFTFTKMTVDEAITLEQNLLKEGNTNIKSFFQAFAIHLQRKPASGNSGSNVSAESQTFGHPMESLDVTLSKLYAAQ